MKPLRTNYLPAVGTFAGCLLGLACLAPSAQAQITHTVTLNGATFGAFEFQNILLKGDVPIGSELLFVSIDVSFKDSVGGTLASDLTFYLAPSFVDPPVATPVMTGGTLAIGNFWSNETGAAQWIKWDNGNLPGDTAVVDSKSQADFGAGIDLSAWNVYVGNSYAVPGVSGTWTGTVEFTYVPEPQHYAIMAGLGLIGFAAVRRQLRNKA